MERPLVTVCRDCCCGSARKHPDVDHAGQVARLRSALGQTGVRVSACLDACERSNIVVVHPTPAARRAGARPVWLGYVLDDAVIGDLTAWVEAGGPGVVPLPEILGLYRTNPPVGQG
ncbi:hypothetical protein AB0K00_46740 [Dactylosporangium sp. NPDC049525]|uniref:hypothetical protein n=1 Tax=Dactylosporangium sp. NPDC049525 TaxID=3154730 RepID=UPI0034287988